MSRPGAAQHVPLAVSGQLAELFEGWREAVLPKPEP